MRGLSLISLLSVLVTMLTADKAEAIVCHCEQQGTLPDFADCTEPLVCDVEGHECFAEIYSLLGEVTRRWGCIPTDARARFCEPFEDLYNISCCNGSDFCNFELYPSLPGNPPVTTTSAPTTTDPIIVETLTTSEPTVTQPSEPTTNTETSTATSNTPAPVTQPATTSPLPAVPTSSRSCYRSTSESPDIRICSLQRSCYVTVRRHSDNRVTFKRGCTPRNSLCVSENRFRKIKTCCSSSLCNTDIPTFDEAPDLIGSTNNTTHNRDNDPITIEPDADPNAPDINNIPTVPSSDTTSTQAVTTETTRETVPPETPPPTNNLPESNCVCDSCESGYCRSTMGCVTIYEQVDDRLKIIRKCIESSAICTYSNAVDFRTECCKGELCNHGNNTITPPPTSPTSVAPTTDGLEQTGPTSSTPTSDETEGSPDASTKGLSVYYILTILVGVIFLVIAVVLLIICVCVCWRHQLNLAEIRKKTEQRRRTLATLSSRTDTLS